LETLAGGVGGDVGDGMGEGEGGRRCGKAMWEEGGGWGSLVGMEVELWTKIPTYHTPFFAS